MYFGAFVPCLVFYFFVFVVKEVFLSRQVQTGSRWSRMTSWVSCWMKKWSRRPRSPSGCPHRPLRHRASPTALSPLARPVELLRQTVLWWTTPLGQHTHTQITFNGSDWRVSTFVYTPNWCHFVRRVWFQLWGFSPLTWFLHHGNRCWAHELLRKLRLPNQVHVISLSTWFCFSCCDDFMSEMNSRQAAEEEKFIWWLLRQIK